MTWILRVLVAISVLVSTFIATAAYATDERKNRLVFLPSEPIEDGVWYFPQGVHFFSSQHPSNIELVGLTVKSFSFGTFNSSRNTGKVVFVAHSTRLATYNRFGLDAFYGLMHGYEGRLAQGRQTPDFLKPLFEGDVNPLVALSPYYKVSDKVEIRSVITPMLATVGLKMNF